MREVWNRFNRDRCAVTPTQLEWLISYIDERAKYEAMAATDDEWPREYVRDAEKALRKVFTEPQEPAP